MSRFLCPECSGGFPSPTNLSKQIDGVGKISVEACPWCGEEFDHQTRDPERPA